MGERGTNEPSTYGLRVGQRDTAFQVLGPLRVNSLLTIKPAPKHSGLGEMIQPVRRPESPRGALLQNSLFQMFLR